MYTIRGPEVPLEGIEVCWAERSVLLRNVLPIRKLERKMVQYGNFYETGRIGAEITYSILKSKLGINGLVLNEPGRGGPDLHTKDIGVLAESRFLIQVEPTQLRDQISRDLAQMARRIRHVFRHNPVSKEGYAVISFLSHGEIDSVVVKLLPPG